MKQILLDLLRGIRTGLFYMMCFGYIVAGICMLCILHTVTPWLAVLIFVLALIEIASGIFMLTIAGWFEREVESEDEG